MTKQTFEDYWKRLAESNPGLLDDELKLTITVASMRKQLQKAFEAGGTEDADKKDAARAFEKFGRPRGPLEDLFKGFGM